MKLNKRVFWSAVIGVIVTLVFLIIVFFIWLSALPTPGDTFF